MTELTEQELKKYGFIKKYLEPYNIDAYEMIFQNKILGDVYVSYEDDNIYITTGIHIIAKRKFTEGNLGLFIRFASGKEL